jgi:hypothetical protein
MNGVLKDTDNYLTSTPAIQPENSKAPVRIGTREFQSFFQGYLADIAFFNTTLSSSDIEAIYNGNRALDLTGDSGRYQASNALTAWYPLD